MWFRVEIIDGRETKFHAEDIVQTEKVGCLSASDYRFGNQHISISLYAIFSGHEGAMGRNWH